MMDIAQLYEVVDKTLNHLHKIRISTNPMAADKQMAFYEWCQVQHE